MAHTHAPDGHAPGTLAHPNGNSHTRTGARTGCYGLRGDSPPGQGPEPYGHCNGDPVNNFFCYIPAMSVAVYRSLPVVPRELKADGELLDALYEAGRRGLEGDALALAAGMLPIELRRLCQMDPLADLAVMKGRADAEMEMSGVVMDAARGGDSKMALEVLRHKFDWSARQEVSVDVRQQISIVAALEAAGRRVLEVSDVELLQPGKPELSFDAGVQKGLSTG